MRRAGFNHLGRDATTQNLTNAAAGLKVAAIGGVFAIVFAA